MKELGVPFHHIDATVHHDNSSTLNSGFHERNSATFTRNHSVFQSKVATNQLTERGWSLQVRRDNRWD
jgi:hypothetical protein